MDNIIACESFRDRLEPLLADEVPAAEREALARHLDGCRDCRALHEFEAGMRSAVTRRLPRVAAPPGLETRIRAALDAATPSAEASAWYARPWFAALAASALLALLVLAGNGRPSHGPGAAGSLLVTGQRVTIVDHDCERAGRTLAEQRKCRDHRHLNMLRVASGNYWFVSLDQADGKRILLDPDMRGRRLVVAGELYPAIHTLRLSDYRPVDGGAFEPGPVSL